MSAKRLILFLTGILVLSLAILYYQDGVNFATQVAQRLQVKEERSKFSKRDRMDLAMQQEFEKTKDLMGFKVPTVITVYTDRSFTFVTKQPTAAALLMKAANLKKGTDNPLKNKVAQLTKAQLMEVVERKIVDLNTDDKEMAANTIAGTARSMGIDIVD